MPKLIFLGTANAIPDQQHENTHFAVILKDRILLVDSASNPVVRLEKAGLDHDLLTDVIVTHFHPDHVSGVPSLLMSTWLMGRKKAMNIYGLEYTLDRVKRMMVDYDWKTWPNFYPVHFVTVPEQEMAPVLLNDDLEVLASPVHHLVPTIGLRFEFTANKKSVAYSCDTEPCQAVVRLAKGADILIHESTGATLGHTSAEQAGEIARQAGVGKLYLIHYPVGDFDARVLVRRAATTFNGPIYLAEDFMEVPLD
jgi:ribonuclease Z